MSRRRVHVVTTGTANLASVRAAFERLDAEVVAAATPQDVEQAASVVLPGVGSFAAGRAALERARLADALVRRVQQGRPTLAICLGLQLLGSGSQEAPGVAGLGVVPITAQRFPDSVPVPQLGWNALVPDAGSRFVEPGHAYFANSFRFVDAPAGWIATRSDHGGGFVAAIERDAVLACQFHPELSGSYGRALLARWLEAEDTPC